MLIKLGKVVGTIGLLIILIYGRAFATYLTTMADENSSIAAPAEVIEPTVGNSLAVIDH